MGYDIYLLRCENDSIYTGIAKDYEERYEKHKQGIGAKYTKIYKPIKIEIVFYCQNRSEASRIERFIKNKKKKEKEFYIKNPEILIENVLKSMKISMEQKK